jgi:hypothetical protein
MDPSYFRNFPDSWDKDKIERYVTDIATDPQILWQQITGEDECILWRPHKFIADGIREGRKIRVFLEPDDRGILTAYPLD